MKQFRKTNTVTHNLMSFTGFKSMLIFSQLVESPKSYKELQEIVRNHEYLHEDISIDALRIYFNSLKQIGCKIEKISVDGVIKYHITSHPLLLKFDDKQVKSILKVFKAISKSIDISDLLALKNFFNKISEYVENDDLKNKLKSISPLYNIDEKLVNDLTKYAKNSAEITIYYNSKTSGRKNITMVIDRIYIENGKLYISGFNTEHQNYSSFLVSNIIRIVSVNLQNKTVPATEITVGYKYIQTDNEALELLDCEKIIETNNNEQIIEMTSKNKFEIMQRVLSLSDKCTVLYPQDFKNYIVSTLKQMKEGYYGN